jgi:hypothetical protein
MPTTEPPTVGGQTQDETPDPLKSLSPRQRLFVMAYISDARFNATEAARQAGYTAKGHGLEVVASRLLRSVEVRSAIDYLLGPRLMTGDEVLTAIRAHADHSDARIRVRALELLARAHGLLADRLKVEGTVNVSQLSDAELEALRRKLGDA